MVDILQKNILFLHRTKNVRLGKVSKISNQNAAEDIHPNNCLWIFVLPH